MATALMALMIPRVFSGAIIVIGIIAPGPGPWRNDPSAPGPVGFLVNPAPPAPPAGLVLGPAGAPPWPMVAGPVPWVPPPGPGGGAPYVLTAWGALVGGGPNFDILVPLAVWDAAGGGPYWLAGAWWGIGVSLGRSIGQATGLDVDLDIMDPEAYWRFYITDPGEVTFTYELEPKAVGGIVIPTDKFALLAPYIGLSSTILVATVATAIYVKRAKRREENR